MKKKLYITFAIIIYSLLFVDPRQVHAELKSLEVNPKDTEIIGTATSNQELMLLHRGEWLKTTAKADGTYKFILPSSAGNEVLLLRGLKNSGYYDEKLNIVPKGNAYAPPLYLGKTGKNLIFRTIMPDANLYLMIGESFMKNVGTFTFPEIPNATKAYAYSIYHGIKSDTKEIDLTIPPEIPFTLDENKIRQYMLRGTTIPYSKILITYTDSSYLPKYQTIWSDDQGVFNERLNYPIDLIRDENRVTFKLSLDVGEDSRIPTIAKKTFDLKIPIVEEDKPLILSDEFAIAGNQLTGLTLPKRDVEIMQDEHIKNCQTDQVTGYFDCGSLDDVKKHFDIHIKDGKDISYATSIDVHQQESDYKKHQAEWTSPTNESEEISGKIDIRFARVELKFLSEDDQYTIRTQSDDEGRFHIKHPKTFSGSFTLLASPMNGKKNLEYYGIKTIKDSRKVPTPEYIYRAGKLFINKGQLKDALLQVGVTIFHSDGTFESSQSSYYSGNIYIVDGIREGDQFTIITRNISGIESEIVKGNIDFPELGHLTEESLKIIGKTTPNRKLFIDLSKNDNVQRIETNSKEDGQFIIDYSELMKKGYYYPKEIGMLETDNNVIYKSLDIKDETAPIISILPISFEAKSISIKVFAQLYKPEDLSRLKITIIYRDGGIEERDVEDSGSSYDYPHEFKMNDIDFSNVKRLEVKAVDFAGNTSETYNATPVDMTLPNLARVDVPISNDTHIRGEGQPGTKVFVEIGGKTFTTLMSDDGRFDVIVNKLRTDEVVKVSLVELISGNKTENAWEHTVRGIKSIELASDRKSLRIKSNATRYFAFRVHIIMDGISRMVTVDSTSKSFSLSRFLKNHESIKFRVINDNGNQVEEITKKFSDTTPPSLPKKISFGNNFKGMNRDYFFSALVEPYARVQLYKEKKIIFSGIADKKGSVSYQVPAPVDVKAKWIIRMTDAVGLSTTTKIVPRDSVPPKKLAVTTVTTQSKTISGMVDKPSKVYIVIGEKTFTTETDENGKFSLKIKHLKLNTKISIYAKNFSGIQSDATKVIYVMGVQILKASEVTSKSVSISGSGTPGAVITLQSSKKQVIKKTTVSKEGIFKMSISKQKKGTSLFLTSTKKSYLMKEIKVLIKK